MNSTVIRKIAWGKIADSDSLKLNFFNQINIHSVITENKNIVPKMV